MQATTTAHIHETATIPDEFTETSEAVPAPARKPRPRRTADEIRAAAETRAKDVEDRAVARARSAVEAAAKTIGGERGEAIRQWLELFPS